jgi:hypothetical protein
MLTPAISLRQLNTDLLRRRLTCDHRSATELLKIILISGLQVATYRAMARNKLKNTNMKDL